MADDLYVSRSGELVATRDGVEVGTVLADGWFGEIGLIEERARTATVTTVEPTTVWQIPGEVFLVALDDAGAAPWSCSNRWPNASPATNRPQRLTKWVDDTPSSSREQRHALAAKLLTRTAGWWWVREVGGVATVDRGVNSSERWGER